MYGWAGQRLKVYLTEGKIVKEELSEELRLDYIGGRGLNSKTLFDELKPGTDPFSPENVVMVGVGPLVGTMAPCASRWTATAKSPLTGILGDGNGGGDFAAELRFAGYDQIVFYGRSPKPVYLWINNDQVELRDASHLWGRTTWDTQDILLKELGDREIRVLVIGPAGENLVRVAKVFTNRTRAGGKGGVGAVMGSKNVKAVAVRGTGAIKIARPREFFQAAKHAHEKLMASPYQQMIREEGAFYIFRSMAQMRSLTTRNSQTGHFEGFENLTTEAFESQFAVKHKGCFSCPIQCCHHYQVKEGPYATHGDSPQFGTTYPFTSKLGSDNLAAGLFACTLCDQLGLDTHSTGAIISFAMEAWQKGLLTAEDTDYLDLSWGNIDAALKLIPKMAYREGFGNILADGSQMASRHIPGSETCLVTAKGMEISALYPGPGEDKVTALAYVTASRGADHLRGIGKKMIGTPMLEKALGKERAKRAEDPRTYDGKGTLLALDNDFVAAINALGVCYFAPGARYGGLDPDDIAALFSTATGVEMDGDALIKVGERIYNIEKAFNVREGGMSRKDDTMPERFFIEKPDTGGTSGVNPVKFQEMLDEHYAFRGWDKQGIPTRKKLEELNLGYVADQIGAT